MFDFRLQVFDTVARRLNFTRAAEELCITQPAVTKHIREIEQHFKVQLFHRNGTKIQLTAAGETLLQYTGQLFGIYRNLEFEMSNLAQKHSGKIRIGASTTVAQYVLPPVLAAFHKKFTAAKVLLTVKNTEQVEQDLQNQQIDLGIIEGRSKNTLFKYTPFIKDELVLVAAAKHPLAKKGVIKPEELLRIPLLLREPGSGTLEVMAHALKPLGIKIAQLQKEMQLESTESAKQYVMHSDCMAFLSVHSVVKELEHNECCIIDVKGLAIERDFFFIRPHGEADALQELFMQFALRYNFR
ncbi:DNA-binding transcriptional regulator, LysR family [Filimonas lacunae]|uniref:DNA-binding transcriptional regulator, LysR family n=1 Tax=Filimonas lacunae TaxID=477680 RepID=A0A173MF35_9BACT|nr:LysR family transcriptional regulator [Filimonas lacunae]BAV06099.1 LysR family transcriptional regulator YeiE [Filimonas lacunae]SIT24652.1 DNA-binding transcriptional regulator, LysR family [Filimonas lacunae]